jgi:3-carboxy-cis,cis-muconate cycloisomerase
MGAWQAEWEALSGALALAGGAAAAAREAVEGLELHPERMRANLSDAVMAERISFLLAERVGRTRAHELVAAAAARGSLRELDVPAEAFDPDSYLGSAGAFVDRALALYREDGP